MKTPAFNDVIPTWTRKRPHAGLHAEFTKLLPKHTAPDSKHGFS